MLVVRSGVQPQRSRRNTFLSVALMFTAMGSIAAARRLDAAVPPQPQSAAAQAAAGAPGTPFTADKLTAMLPPSVYFQGRTAPLQLRNAAGVSFGKGNIVWAALVDSSGYASSVQQQYQFYLVTEGPIRIGDAHLGAGAYGGGFIGDKFEIMDVGGHRVAEGPVQSDEAMKRPRPLQMLPRSATEVVLALGRHTVPLHAE